MQISPTSILSGYDPTRPYQGGVSIQSGGGLSNPGLQGLAANLFAQLDGRSNSSSSPSGTDQVLSQLAGPQRPQPFAANIDPTAISPVPNTAIAGGAKPFFASLDNGNPTDIAYDNGQQYRDPRMLTDAATQQFQQVANQFRIGPQTNIKDLMNDPKWNLLHATNPDAASKIYELKTGRDYKSDFDLFQKGRESQQTEATKSFMDLQNYPRNTLQKWIADGQVRLNPNGGWDRLTEVPNELDGGLTTVKKWAPAGIQDMAVIAQSGGLKGLNLPGPPPNPLVDEMNRRVLAGEDPTKVRAELQTRAQTDVGHAPAISALMQNFANANPNLRVPREQVNTTVPAWPNGKPVMSYHNVPTSQVIHPTDTPSGRPAPTTSTQGTPLNSMNTRGIIPGLYDSVKSAGGTEDNPSDLVDSLLNTRRTAMSFTQDMGNRWDNLMATVGGGTRTPDNSLPVDPLQLSDTDRAQLDYLKSGRGNQSSGSIIKNVLQMLQDQ